MKILITASECAPLVKVGGIADVIGSLPIVLKEQGLDARLALPYYKPLKEKITSFTEGIEPQKIFEKNIEYGDREEKITIYVTKLPNSEVPVYLVENKFYISDGGVYYTPETMPSPELEIERFAFFSKIIAEVFGTENEIFKPDLIHCNDWHTGMVPQIIQSQSKKLRKPATKTIFTIHNLAYQGFSSVDVAEKLGENIKADQTLSWDAQDDNLDFILQGIVNADFVNTVSEKYSEEIQTEEYGEGLQDVLQARKARLTGVLNGISYEMFNPKTDSKIHANYDLANWQKGKAANKKALQEEFGLDIDPEKPILGVVSRLVHQKGLDLVAESVKEIIGMGYQFVLLGTGDAFIETQFSEITEKGHLNGAYSANITFSDELARKIYAAADMFLIPSRFEPCGLTQMIAMKYGTVPIVRATGGLYDTVHTGENGFAYKAFTVEDMLDSIKSAYTEYKKNPSNWETLVETCMQKDFSWKESAKKYIDLYQKVINL